jgi:hypothetical protein
MVDLLDSLFDRIRVYPYNLILVIATYFGVTFSLTSGTPTIPPISDFAYYVDMANGLFAPDPFGKRILMPFIVGLLGGSPYTFHYLNLALITMCTTLLYLSYGRNQQSFISGLLFLACTRAITLYAGEPSPDGMTYFLIASAIFLVNTKYHWLNLITITLAAANHPISLVIVGVIIVIYNYDKPERLLTLIPGAIVFLLLMPTSYGTIFIPDIPRLLNMVKSVNVLWLGVFAIRRDKESVLLILIILCTFGFSLIASNIDRILSPLGMFLAPMFLSLLYPKKDDESDTIDNP